MRQPIFSNDLKGIIFDCDGVMIDSEEANRYWYNTILAQFGIPPMTPEQENYAFMATATDALKKMIPGKFHDEIPAVIERVIDYKKDILPRDTLMPGFVDFINQAHKRHLLLAIDTNRTAQGIQVILDFFHLPNYFNPIVSSSIVSPKPSPQGINLICRDWQTTPEHVLFIGDSENDCKTAWNAGAKFVAFSNKACNGDISVSSYAELARILWNDH